MDKKLSKLIGIKKDEFDAHVKNGAIHLSEARLIPTYKPGDEMALTSVLLTAVRLVKEFGKIILSASNMTSGKMYAYTEVQFPKHKDLGRADGLLIVVKGGTIRDAALLEMKNGKDDLNKEQIERYLQLAKEYSIPKMITVSNQFVSEPSQSPVITKAIKGVELFHFSWSYLLTIAHVLLFKNDLNIEDEDQVEIMHEVISYFEDNKSGVLGFHQMKPGWGDVVDKISTGASLKADDKDVCDTVVSWQQEEKDLALILSRNLGVLVDSGERKYKGNLAKRWSDDKESLIKDGVLSSTLRVKDAVSDIKVVGQLDKRTIEMSVSLKAPHDKTTRGKMGWLMRQLDNCKKKNTDLFTYLQDKIYIDIRMKNSRQAIRVNLSSIDDIYEDVKDKEIVEFGIAYINFFGRKFASPKKFVELIEQMLLDYYSCIIQYLTKWEPSAPKMSQSTVSEHLAPAVATPPQESPKEETEAVTASTLQSEGHEIKETEVQDTAETREPLSELPEGS